MMKEIQMYTIDYNSFTTDNVNGLWARRPDVEKLMEHCNELKRINKILESNVDEARSLQYTAERENEKLKEQRDGYKSEVKQLTKDVFAYHDEITELESALKEKVEIKNDPFKLVLDVYKDLYGDVNIDLAFDINIKKRYLFFGMWGYTNFEKKVPVVRISAHLSVYHAVEILAHELAHVRVGLEEEHNEKWEECFSKIHHEFCKRVERLEL